MKVSRRNFLKTTAASLPVLTACSAKGGGLMKVDPVPALNDFGFVHITDTHISPWYNVPDDLSSERSFRAVREMLKMTADSVPFAAGAEGEVFSDPAFWLHTGDLTEYGFPGKTNSVVKEYFAGLEKPFYWVAGNHDNTWVPNAGLLQEEFGGTDYFFDHGGVRFIGLNSASVQEPLPSFSMETIEFLEQTLGRTSKVMPIILFWHHPIGGANASPFDADRIFDMVRPYNVMLLLLGHHHVGQLRNEGDLDACIGNAPFTKGGDGDYEGFSMVEVRNGTLRVVDIHAFDAQKQKVLLSKPVPTGSDYPAINFLTPSPWQEVTDNNLELTSMIDHDGAVERQFQIDGTATSDQASLDELDNGCHVVKVVYSDAQNNSWYRSQPFMVNRSHPRSPMARWKARLGSSIQGAPVVSGDRLYVGDNKGRVTAVNATSGQLAWQVETGGAILRAPVIWKDRIVVTNAAGSLSVLTQSGLVVSAPRNKNAIHFTPVIDEHGVAYYGDLEGKIFAVDLESGEEKWTNEGERLSVESRPLLIDNKLIVNFWDGYIRCFDTASGDEIWSVAGPRNQTRQTPSRYYGPADTAPVLWKDKLYVTDRGYNLGAYDLDGNFLGQIAEDVAAHSVCASGEKLICRRTSSSVNAIDEGGKEIWASDFVAGRNPVAPTCLEKMILISSDKGRLHGLDVNSGTVQWTYQVTANLYQFGGIAVNEDQIIAYAAGMDGVLHGVDLAPGSDGMKFF